jgi:hypothetical protein
LAAVLSVSALINIGQPAKSSASTTPTTASVQMDGRQQGALHDAMRKLWEQHVLWTRLFIVSDVAGLPDLQATTARLLANQSDIGNAIKPFYGTANGDHLTSLLMQHILQAAQILADAKAGNSTALTQDEQAWYANANQIASFLHSLNPQHWPLPALQAMMKAHLDLTLTEAVDQLQGNFTASVSEFDSVENEILGMADTLSSGIIAQFSQNS